MKRAIHAVLLGGSALLTGMVASSSTAVGPIVLLDATDSSGITFVHTDGSAGRRHIVETIASGVGLIDFDNDGHLDLYFLNGAPLPGTAPSGTPPVNALYRNNGDGTFTDVTRQTSTGDLGYALGCAVADYDNDGDEDIYITNYGPNRLLRNNGDGTFSDFTAAAGVGDPAFSAGCSFLDYDRDGDVDLYANNYLEFDPATAKPCLRANIPVYCDPRTYPPVADRLYRNNGDGTFTDVSQSSGIGGYQGYGMGMGCGDLDDDGWPDILVGNDVMENFLFRNRGDGTFEEVGLLAGVAYDQYGDEQGTMGVNLGDYDGDGRFDVLVTDYQKQPTTLYRNLGELQFQDVTVATGAGTGSIPLVTWACGLADFDNDGNRELFTTAGHLQDTVEQFDQTSTYKQRNVLLAWREGRFTDIAEESGPGLQVVESSRGAALGDLDNDGDVDVVVQNARARPTLLINQTAPTNNWSILKLIGTRSNRSAVGAVVRLTAGSRTQVDEVRSGRGYQSAEDLRIHFGLGQARTIDRIEIRWPSGESQTLTNVEPNAIHRIVESAP